jgi:hypothetical protein
MSATGEAPKLVFWHRELPPLDGEVLHEHVVAIRSSTCSI